MKLQNIIRLSALAISLLVLLKPVTGVSQTQLVLDGGIITIAQGAYLVIDNPASNAITRTTGYIVSEGENNVIQWNIGTTTGTYTIPWGYSATYIPITFTKTAGTGSGHFLFSTYHTGWQNSTQLPTTVANMNGIAGTDYSAFASDRFWQVNAQGYSTKPTFSNLVFTYTDAENATTNNTITESNLKAYRYNSSLTSWTDNIMASTLNTTSNTVTVASVSVSDVQPWWSVGMLGANRYWVAPSFSYSNLSANWAASSGGAGNAGVPTLVDVMVFDAGSNSMCIIDANVSAANWSIGAGYSGIISQGTSTITLSNTATLSGGTFIGGSVDIAVGGTFTLSGTSFTSTSANLELKKDFTASSGSFVHNNGTVKFSGTAAVTQQINGAVVNTFKNITLTNTSVTPGLRIESNQNIAGVLSLTSNASMDADGSANTAVFKLLSTTDSPTQDASVAILPSGAQVTGNVTVQRFMTKEGRNNARIYRYISSPVQNASVADLQNELPITGSFTGTSICGTCLANQSMFAYDESVITDTNGNGTANFDDGYLDFPSASNTETLMPGKGYAMFVFGSVLSTTSWDVRGPINSGNVTPVSLPVTYASSGNILNDGWNLVGNPFPSTMDWNASSGWTKTNLGGAIYISDNGSPQTALQYATWNGSVGTNGGSRYIATGQAFWTKANGSGVPVLQANENTKASGTQTTFFREGELSDMLRITMYKGTERDETVIHFRENATRAFDSNADAWKLKNGSFNLSSLSENNESFAINSSSPLNCNTTIKLSVNDAAAGQYSLKFTNLDSFEGAALILSDVFLNRFIPITDSSVYAFTITTAVASSGNDRFLLMFNKTPPPVNIQSVNGVLTIDYSTNIQWYFNDQLIAGAILPTLIPDKSGTYRVVVKQGECELNGSIELLITGVEDSLAYGITVYPNPVTNEVSITAISDSIESITVMNMLGETLGKIQLTGEQGNQTGKFDMSQKAPGIYILKIVENNIIYLKKVIKK